MAAPGGIIFAESRDCCAGDPANWHQFLISCTCTTTTSATAAPFSPTATIASMKIGDSGAEIIASVRCAGSAALAARPLQ